MFTIRNALPECRSRIHSVAVADNVAVVSVPTRDPRFGNCYADRILAKHMRKERLPIKLLHCVLIINIIIMLEARLVLAGDSGFRDYIINHVYIALRYLVCVDKICDTFCGNVGQNVIFSLTFSHFISLSLSITLSIALPISLYLYFSLSLSLSLSFSLSFSGFVVSF